MFIYFILSFIPRLNNENPSYFTTRTTLFFGIFVPNVQVDKFNWFHSFVYSCLIKTPLCFISEQLWILVLDMIHLFQSFISLEQLWFFLSYLAHYLHNFVTHTVIFLRLNNYNCLLFQTIMLVFETWIEGMQHMIRSCECCKNVEGGVVGEAPHTLIRKNVLFFRRFISEIFCM